MTSQKKKQAVTKESQYIQQHLANERTYLAWVRTAIAIIGIGFLVTNLHGSAKNALSDLAIKGIGILAIMSGIITIILALRSYLLKVRQINENTFRSTKFSIFFLSVMVVLITVVLGIYYLAE
ncbi:YidH family protein [Bacillus massiliglaciei]|uniref:YidH family protein n=1 Tax=Bacillus massiliglaciei TaxID=1816693 RepID=UPI000ABF6ED5|nr:DUF202 domain-containing protein [Bacillus massiliglaciei]